MEELMHTNVVRLPVYSTRRFNGRVQAYVNAILRHEGFPYWFCRSEAEARKLLFEVAGGDDTQIKSDLDLVLQTFQSLIKEFINNHTRN